MIRATGLALAAMLTLGCGTAPTGSAPPPPWKVVTVPNQPPARFVWQPDGSVRVTTDSAVGFLLRPTPEAAQGARLEWRWLVERTPPPSAPDAVGQDDRPIAVHVIFATAAPDDRALGGLRRWLRGALTHEAFAGRTLTYMWGGTLPAGTRLPNPYLPGDGHIIVLRDGSTRSGTWLPESIDPVADYTSLFGGTARPTHLALSADTEDRGGCAVALIQPPTYTGTGKAKP